jgi:TolB-like protein/class 3 adenylate cyclase/rhodanese-related sulfurtransferase/Flp pilus assembly protein TadD
MERRLAAILSTDVVGYTRLMEADEAGTLEAIKALRSDLIDPLIAEHRGRIVKLMGDGALVEFASAVDAVACAIEIQRDLTEQNADAPKDRRIELRIGINLGDVIVEGDDIYGEGVNVASRLEGIAEPGGVCISEKIYQEVEKKLDLEFAHLGELQVKNIEKPVRTYAAVLGDKRPVAPKDSKSRLITQGQLFAAVVIAIALIGSGVIAWLKPWAPDVEPASVERMAFPLPDKPSIAVLPFANMSDDPAQEYFADGMAEDIITDLSKISGLFVIARNSSFSYKGQSVKVGQVAQELGVRYVLEGSVRRVGDQVRINAQLIDATTGGHLWADRYDGTLANVFALQDEVIGKVVSALAVNLTVNEEAQRAQFETDHSEAYDAFLQGWAHYQLRTPDDLAKSVPYFEEAIRVDAGYTRADAALAAVYWESWNNGWVKSLNIRSFQAYRLAEKHLQEAMKVPTPLAHSLSSRILASRGKYEEAVLEAHRGLALDSNDPTVYAALANALILAGRPAEGADFIGKAMRLDPRYPPSYLIDLGRAKFAMERFEDAAATLERAVKRNIDNEWAWIYLAATYGHLGRKTEGQSAIETFNVLRADAGLHELNPETIDLTRFGVSSNQERVRSGLSEIPPPTWSTLITRSGSGVSVQGSTAIDVSTAKSLYDRGVRFIDVRDPKSWSLRHIPAAFSLWLGGRLSEARVMEIVDKSEEVVFYCNCGPGCNMSPIASAKAVAWGYQNVYYFKGAIDAWDSAGYSLDQGE